MSRQDFEPVTFDYGDKGAKQAEAFCRKCEDPRFVAECLAEHQSWRRGTGRYAFSEESEPPAQMPFCPKALGIIEDAAIKFLMNYYGTVKNGKIVDFKGTIHG